MEESVRLVEADMHPHTIYTTMGLLIIVVMWGSYSYSLDSIISEREWNDHEGGNTKNNETMVDTLVLLVGSSHDFACR